MAATRTAFAPGRVLLRSSGLGHQSRLLSRGLSQPSVRARWLSIPPMNGPPRFAFSFESVCPCLLCLRTAADLVSSIDGVLLHKSEPIPGAADTLKSLQESGIPFILLTNGGGKSEAERAAELSSLLGINLPPSALVQSHTPFQSLLAETDAERTDSIRLWANTNWGILPRSLRDKTVMVTGSNASKARRIATEYGFQSVVTPGDILKACPEIFPFDPLPEFYDKQEVLPLPKPLYSPKNGPETLQDSLQIHAVLVFNDPRDWAVDIQLIKDLLDSHQGYLGTRASDFKPQDDKPYDNLVVPIIFSNSDYQWSAGYHLPRLGQGSFQSALHGNIAEASQDKGQKLHIPFYRFGKPYPTAYRWAERALREQACFAHGKKAAKALQYVYMVGDNPESDIRGANLMKSRNYSHELQSMKWRSCLVRTGVWKDRDELVIANRRPNAIRDDVKGAVEWALKQECHAKRDPVKEAPDQERQWDTDPIQEALEQESRFEKDGQGDSRAGTSF